MESKAGKHFYAANGSEIRNYGRRKIEGTVSEGHRVDLSMEAADVTRVLASVRQMVRVGNRVVFDEEESVIENKQTGMRPRLKEKPGGYTFQLKVRKKPIDAVASGQQGQDFQRQAEAEALQRRQQQASSAPAEHLILQDKTNIGSTSHLAAPKAVAAASPPPLLSPLAVLSVPPPPGVCVPQPTSSSCDLCDRFAGCHLGHSGAEPGQPCLSPKRTFRTQGGERERERER